MTVGELRRLMFAVPDSMEVVVRVQGNGGDDQLMGGVTGAQPDAGCTEREVFMIDADEDEGELEDLGFEPLNKDE